MRRLEQFIGVAVVIIGGSGLLGSGPGAEAATPPVTLSASDERSDLSQDSPDPPPLAPTPGAIAQAAPPPTAIAPEELNLDPALVETSPVLQDWLEEVPDVLDEIRHDPAFRTRLRLRYTHFPDRDAAAGIGVGLEDLFIGRTGLTLSADYQTPVAESQATYGADLRYYLLPLGSYVNLAPVLGYRHLALEDGSTEGVNVGARVMLALSRTGAADLALTQVWTAPGQAEEVGTTTLSLGYGIAPRWRITTELERQGSRQGEEARWGLGVEWLP